MSESPDEVIDKQKQIAVVLGTTLVMVVWILVTLEEHVAVMVGPLVLILLIYTWWFRRSIN